MRAACLVASGALCPELQVELLEDRVALVRCIDTGRTEHVDRDALPHGVREGEVVRGGERAVEATERLRAEVRLRLADWARPVPANFQLGEGRGAEPRLTDEEEK